MADFRRLFFALAVVALVISSAPTANAQANFACSATASTPIVRVEGLTELLGDILLSCTGGSDGAGGVLSQYSISLTLNTNITNTITDTGTPGANPFVDAAVHVGSAAFNVSQLQTGASVGQTAPITGNLFQARRTSDSTITFNNVPMTTGTIALRITGVRANASTLAPLAPVTGFITTTRLVPLTGELTVTNNFFNMAVPQTGLSFSTLSASGGTFSVISVLSCLGLNTSLSMTSTSATTASFVLRFREGQVSSFRTAAQEHANPINTGTVAGLPTGYGLATQGTRLRAVFTNVPAGVRIFVTVTPISTGSTATFSATSAALVNSDVNGANATGGTVLTTAGAGTIIGTSTSPVGAALAEITVTGGTGVATWEIMASNTLASEDLGFGVALRSAAGSSVAGTGQVGGSFAPVAPAGSGRVSLQSTVAFGQVPRFADSAPPADVFNSAACITNLLFPFVTSQAGFETGIALTNTSLDPGAPLFTANNSQAGTCTVNFYGNVTTNPTSRTTTSVPAGKSATFLLGGPNAANPDAYGMPDAPAANFAGYIIASCNFRFAHGFAFITDAHRNNFGAMGYIAMVLDAAAATRTTSAGENVGH